MSEPKPNQADSIIRKLAGRLTARRCRGVKVNLPGTEYPVPDKISFVSSGGEGRIPDITTDIPAFIIEVEDSESIDDPKTLEYCKKLADHARVNFKTFILVAPKAYMDRFKIKISKSNIKNILFIWY
jgi:hypothetical protein